MGQPPDGCGDIYVAYAPTPTGLPVGGILHFDPEGGLLGSYGAPLQFPGFLDFDAAGDLFVADTVANKVYRILPDETVLEAAHLERAWGVAACRGSAPPPCRPRLCDAGEIYEAPCGETPVCITLDGSRSSLRGCTGRAFTWTSDCPGARFDDPTLERPTLCTDARGCDLTCTVRLEVRADDLRRSCEAEVRVIDREAPVVTPAESPLACMWPPDHRYACFSTADLAPQVHDSCLGSTWRFSSCVSDQLDDARGGGDLSRGDGSTTGDCLVSADGLTLCARAERAGNDPSRAGRNYALAIVAEDECGNVGEPVFAGAIHVPHQAPPGGCVSAKADAPVP